MEKVLGHLKRCSENGHVVLVECTYSSVSRAHLTLTSAVVKQLNIGCCNESCPVALGVFGWFLPLIGQSEDGGAVCGPFPLESPRPLVFCLQVLCSASHILSFYLGASVQWRTLLLQWFCAMLPSNLTIKLSVAQYRQINAYLCSEVIFLRVQVAGKLNKNGLLVLLGLLLGL